MPRRWRGRKRRDPSVPGELAEEYTTRFAAAETVARLEQVGRALTAAVKQRLMPEDLERVRRAYAQRLAQLKRRSEGRNANDGPNGTTEQDIPAERTAFQS
jgi:hypothetical protein